MIFYDHTEVMASHDRRCLLLMNNGEYRCCIFSNSVLLWYMMCWCIGGVPMAYPGDDDGLMMVSS
jgi:hypothetical protein